MAGHTDNSILIHAPRDHVWARANDIADWPRLFAGEYAAAEVLAQVDDMVRFRLTTEPRNGSVYKWVSERYLDAAAGTVVARRIDTGPFRYLHIFQSFTSEPEGTCLRWVQDFEARAEAPFDDAQMQAHINTSSDRNLRRHKHLLEPPAGTGAPAHGNDALDGDNSVDGAGSPREHGRIDLRVPVNAPIERVWAVANNRSAWAHAGHPAPLPYEGQGGERAGFAASDIFKVTTPIDAAGRSWTFNVQRICDEANKTVFSRRFGCPEFVYNTVWFGYDPIPDGTEMRCVTDFEMAPGASASTAEMTEIMQTAMTANLTQIARLAKGSDDYQGAK